MKLIVGLGNPGKKYEKTRHNLGFMVIDALAREQAMYNVQFTNNKVLRSEILETRVGEEKVILAKPHTYVNNSGMAVRRLMRFYNILNTSDIWIIHDDLDLLLAKVKIRPGGAAGGHHGVESIIEALKTDQFLRFRLGIKPLSEWTNQQKVDNVEKFVLESFMPKERDEVEEMISDIKGAIKMALEKGPEAAMNKYNG